MKRMADVIGQASTPIQRADLVGAQIVDLHETYELLDGGCDYHVIYFTVDRGFTFVTPAAGRLWTTEELPKEAERLPDSFVKGTFIPKRSWFGFGPRRWVRQPSATVDTVRRIKMQRITGVYCWWDEEDSTFEPWPSGILVLEDGTQVSNPRAAPHGTGGAGLFVASRDGGTPMDQLVDFFSIPPAEDDSPIAGFSGPR